MTENSRREEERFLNMYPNDMEATVLKKLNHVSALILVISKPGAQYLANITLRGVRIQPAIHNTREK